MTKSITGTLQTADSIAGVINYGRSTGAAEDVSEIVWSILESTDLVHRAFADDNTLYTNENGDIYII